MIQMEIHGRLGNQMFQYAGMRGLMEKYGYKPMKINFSKGVYSRGFKNDLNNFNVIGYDEVEKIEISVFQKILLLIEKILERLLRKLFRNNFFNVQNLLEKKLLPILSKNGIFLLQQGYAEFKKSSSKNQICIGGFESAKYFDNIRDKILEEFTPKEKRLEKNLELYDIIDKNESVCVSIRRGDFLSEKNVKAHYVCKPEYFKKAIDLIYTKIDNPIFVIFSDDIEWVKKNMKFQGKVFFETGDDPVWEKLRLMYSCKHFVISNSTFSWWAQYLSRNKNKIVIAPSKWKNTYQNSDIYDDDWILIDV